MTCPLNIYKNIMYPCDKDCAWYVESVDVCAVKLLALKRV